MITISVPQTQATKESIVAQLEGSISTTFRLLPKAFVRVLAKVLSGLFVQLYKYGAWSLLQQFSAYASFQETEVNGRTIIPLVEVGRRVGVDDPEDATRAEHTITVTVLSQVGSLASGQPLTHAPSGVVHVTKAAVALNAPTVEVTIVASSDQDGNGGFGVIGNMDVGETVSFATPPPNVATDAVVSAQTVTGADAESEDAYRGRVERREQRRPQGGAYADYQAWGEEGAGILNVYPYTGQPGQVDVYVEATEASSGSADGFPTAAQIEAVRALIRLDENGQASRRSANAAVNVLSIFRTAFDFTITGLQADDTAAAQTAINTAVDEYLRSREPFIEGLSVLPRADRVTESAVAGVADEAASAIGATFTTLALNLSGANQPAYTLGFGEKTRLGTGTYV